MIPQNVHAGSLERTVHRFDADRASGRATYPPARLNWNLTSISAGRMLYREGAPADRLFTIKSGLVKLVAHLPSGRDRILGLHGAGTILGLVTGPPASGTYGHTAVTLTDVEATWASAIQLRQLRRQHPEEYLRLIERHCEGLEHAKRWITEFSADTTTRRIARVIKYLAELQTQPGPNQVELLTCQEMADVVGVSTESASRVLARFKRSKILRAADTAQKNRCYYFDAAAIERLV